MADSIRPSPGLFVILPGDLGGVLGLRDGSMMSDVRL